MGPAMGSGPKCVPWASVPRLWVLDSCELDISAEGTLQGLLAEAAPKPGWPLPHTRPGLCRLLGGSLLGWRRLCRPTGGQVRPWRRVSAIS